MRTASSISDTVMTQIAMTSPLSDLCLNVELFLPLKCFSVRLYEGKQGENLAQRFPLIFHYN